MSHMNRCFEVVPTAAWRSLRLLSVALLLATTSIACSERPQLMPTPNLYTHPGFDPFAEVPPALQNNLAEVMYITDRAPETEEKSETATAGMARYGLRRSRSAAFGVAELQIGDDQLSWQELVKQSRTAKRDKKLELKVVSARELGRFQPTPPKLVVSDRELVEAAARAESEAESAVQKQFIDELTARLEKTPRKEVYLFIHGFNVDFDGAIMCMGELWHFLGREGVPMAYTWPAGQGAVRAYEYTNQSAMFTNYHLKQALRLIASCPTLEKVHIIAHSRGTAVANDAVRELYLEMRGTQDTRKVLKIGTCVLAAADLDLDVVIQRYATERVGRAIEGVAVYVSKTDKALSFSNWLSGGMMRLGTIKTEIFEKDEIETLRNARRIQFIDARLAKPGLGHSYFHENPAVSSDLILYLRYGLLPGGDAGRPLGVSDSGFWIIDDSYPGSFDRPWFQAIQRGAATTRPAS